MKGGSVQTAKEGKKHPGGALHTREGRSLPGRPLSDAPLREGTEYKIRIYYFGEGLDLEFGTGI